MFLECEDRNSHIKTLKEFTPLYKNCALLWPSFDFFHSIRTLQRIKRNNSHKIRVLLYYKLITGKYSFIANVLFNNYI